MTDDVWGTAAANCGCPNGYILADHSPCTLTQPFSFANAHRHTAEISAAALGGRHVR
jgi:hypothetical protein